MGFMQCGNFDWLSGYRWIWQGILPWTASSTNTWVNQPIFPSTAGKYAGKLCATMGNYWYKPNLRNIPRPSWRGTEWSGGLVVLKRSFTVSLRLLDVLSVFWGGVVVLVLLVLFLFLLLYLDIQSFAHLSALQQLEISWPTMPRARSAIATKRRPWNHLPEQARGHKPSDGF